MLYAVCAVCAVCCVCYILRAVRRVLYLCCVCSMLYAECVCCMYAVCCVCCMCCVWCVLYDVCCMLCVLYIVCSMLCALLHVTHSTLPRTCFHHHLRAGCYKVSAACLRHLCEQHCLTEGCTHGRMLEEEDPRAPKRAYHRVDGHDGDDFMPMETGVVQLSFLLQVMSSPLPMP